MRHRRVAWLVALPVATASWLNEHCLAYVLVPPAASDHMHHHAEGGHAYIGSAPVLIAAMVTVLGVKPVDLMFTVFVALREATAKPAPARAHTAVAVSKAFLIGGSP